MTLAVIVPTVNRADVLEGLVANIHETTETKHKVYLVMEDEDKDSLKASEDLDTLDVVGKFGSNATAVNAGYRASTEPFLAIVNDDCRFHAGWDTTALAYMSDDVHIVGLNQGNGVCTCFFMVRRSYIRQHSGVYDQPDTLFHPYASQFPDTEFAEYAQHRGVWAEAQDSLVEHLHWTFGKSDANHPNYVKQQASFADDSHEYARRKLQWAV